MTVCVQVKERVRAFVEKMLQQISEQHWGLGGGEEPLSTAVEGKPDDGVRGFPVHVLVVTHGAYMCVAARYFVEELQCSLPPGCDRTHMFSLSPNTGLCRFILTVREGDGDQRFVPSDFHCVFVHRGDHVKK